MLTLFSQFYHWQQYISTKLHYRS